MSLFRFRSNESRVREVNLFVSELKDLSELAYTYTEQMHHDVDLLD